MKSRVDTNDQITVDFANAIKKNGVARQCIIHKPLANAPIASDLKRRGSKINFLIEIFINFIIFCNLL